MIVFLIEISLFFFVGLGTGIDGSFTDTSKLYDFLTKPNDYLLNNFYIIMIAVLSLSALASIIPGSFYQVNQWALFAGAAAIIVTFVGSIVNLWTFINGQLVSMFSSSQMGGLIASLITAPLLLFYVVSVIEWSRQN